MYGCSMLHAQHWLAPALVVTSVGRDVFMPCRTPPEITALLNLSQTKALLNPSLDQSPCSPGVYFPPTPQHYLYSHASSVLHDGLMPHMHDSCCSCAAGKVSKSGEAVDVWTNFREYKLQPPAGLVRADAHRPPFRHDLKVNL